MMNQLKYSPPMKTSLVNDNRPPRFKTGFQSECITVGYQEPVKTGEIKDGNSILGNMAKARRRKRVKDE